MEEVAGRIRDDFRQNWCFSWSLQTRILLFEKAWYGVYIRRERNDTSKSIETACSCSSPPTRNICSLPLPQLSLPLRATGKNVPGVWHFRAM